ncbi:capsular biosynthesis protein [Paraburkholderia denitrificans]|uniref:Capsular biosynthesis protein n=1 Tax=Paraburkholderia denitrificans TaxID=694025 RepID=A0ABW0JAU1_9BURK
MFALNHLVRDIFTRIVQWHACALGVRKHSKMPGPVWSDISRGLPMLSWYIATPEPPDRVLDAALRDPTLGISPDMERIVRRVLESNATPARDHWLCCPRTLRIPRERTRVLVIDQRQRSLTMAGIVQNDPLAFSRMIESAFAAHRDAQFWIVHSGEVARGRWLSSMIDKTPVAMNFIDGAHALCKLLAHVDHVYTLGAAEGMHALLSGKPVHVFGAPYYAGWGLTHDADIFPDRHARPSALALFELTFIRWARYINPLTHEEGSLDQLLDAIEAHYRTRNRFADLPDVVGVRFQWWKRPFATPFLTAGGNAIRWAGDTALVACNECAALWGARSTSGLAAGAKHVRIEDGFLHSCGLGSDMVAPMSQVVDRRGIYFDASQPSDLSVLLNEAHFDETELARSSALRRSIVDAGLTKYNLGRRALTWRVPHGKRIVLVPGQVADDASIRFATRAVNTAEDLLREVRRLRPDAFIVYRPHPDVLSGNRTGLIDAQRLADIVDINADLITLVDCADEVHTLSSLAGFDALLRGKPVFTYGLPFYAGWGLTHDALAQIPWRNRKLSLDMLVAGALIRYPVYWDRYLGIYTTPEAVVRRLAARASRPLLKHSRHRRMALKMIRWSGNAIRHLLWRVQHAPLSSRNPHPCRARKNSA